MLTAAPEARRVEAEPLATRPATVKVRIRRRRTLAVLAAALTAAVAVAAASGSAVSAGLAALIGVVAVTYVVLLARLRQLAIEREMAVAFSRDTTFDWVSFERELAADARRLARSAGATGATGVAGAPAGAVEPPAVEVGHRDLVRFIGAYALGWALTPVVGLIRLTGGDLAQLQRHPVIDRLVRVQRAGRAQSLRLLAAGLVATASVATVGGLAGGVLSGGAAYAATVGQGTYTVQAGDTLSSLAARFGTTVAALAAANDLTDRNLIFTGQQLVVPGGGTGTAGGTYTAGGTGTAGGTYTVQAGDTLGSIAARFGTTVAELAALNDIADPNLILVGETLEVDGTASATPAATLTVATTPATGTYTVEVGDTLGSIAARFGTTVAELAALNDIADPNRILAGQVLRVEGSASTATVAASPAPASSPAAGTYAADAAVAVRTALAQVGVPYVWGGASPSEGFDCSGLVMYAWAAAGVDLVHNAAEQWADDTVHISEAQLQPGDLVFYNNYAGQQPGHVTMYVGGGEVVSANETGTDVQVQSLSYDGTIWGFGKVII